MHCKANDRLRVVQNHALVSDVRVQPLANVGVINACTSCSISKKEIVQGTLIFGNCVQAKSVFGNAHFNKATIRVSKQACPM